MNTNSSTPSMPLANARLTANIDDSSTHSFALIKPDEAMDRPTRQQQQTVARVYSEQAWLYFQAQNWDKAIAACKNSLEIAADNVDAYKILGNILQRQGKKPEALGIYARALAIDPDSAAIHANLGSFYAEQKQWQQALDYFQQAVILDPNFAGAPEYFSFGAELYKQGKVQEASIFYIQGVKLDPQAETELIQLVKILEELEQWQQAVAYYRQLMSLDSPNGKDIKGDRKPIARLLSRRQAKAEKNTLKNAVKVFSSPSKSTTPQLLPSNDISFAKINLDFIPDEKRPNSAIDWNNLGNQYAYKQDWAKAIGCYQAAVQLEPNFPKSYRNLARVYTKIQQPKQACLCWYKSFTLEPNEVKPDEYFSLAKHLLEQGQVTKAIVCLRRTIELKPDLKTAHLILGKLLNRRKK